MTVRAIVRGIWRWGTRLLGVLIGICAAVVLYVGTFYIVTENIEAACRSVSNLEARTVACTRALAFWDVIDDASKRAILLSRGDAYYEKQMFRRARDDYDAALSLRKTPRVLYARGMAEVRADGQSPSSLTRSLKDFDAAIEAGGDFANLHAMRGLVLFDLKEWREAHQALVLAEEKGAEGEMLVSVLRHRGEAAFYLGANQLTEADMSRLIAEGQELGFALSRRADAKCRQGDLDGALADLSRLEREAPETLKSIQAKLKQEELYAGPVDGRFSDATRRGILKLYGQCLQASPRIAPG